MQNLSTPTPTPVIVNPKQIVIRNRLFLLMGAIIALFVTLVICLSIYFLKYGLDDKINFALQEKRGNAMQIKLEAVLHDLLEERLCLMRITRGSSSTKEQLNGLQQNTERDFEDLEETNNLLGEVLLFTPKGLNDAGKSDKLIAPFVHGDWNTIKGKDFKTPDEVQQNYGELIQHIQDMIVHNGNKSNLILDPDLDAYFLMTVTVTLNPPNHQHLEELQEYLEGIQGKPVTPDIARELTSRIAVLKEGDFDHIETSGNTALTEDKNFPPNRPREIPRFQNEYTAALNSFVGYRQQILALTDKLIGGDVTQYDPLIRLVEQCRGDSFQLFSTGVSDLDLLLDDRVDALQSDKGTGILVGGVALVIIIFLSLLTVSYFVTTLTQVLADESHAAAREQTISAQNRLIQAQTQSIEKVVARLATGDLTSKVPITEGDLGAVADAINVATESYSEYIEKSKEASTKVTAASQVLNGITETLSEAASKQENAIDKTSQALGELGKEARQVLQTCSIASRSVINTSASVRLGQQAIGNTLKVLSSLTQEFSILTQRMKAQREAVQQINEFEQMVNDIASTTTTLALQCAIDAGRAEANNPLAEPLKIIADQIGKLSQQAKIRASEIRGTIQTLREETSSTSGQLERQTPVVLQAIEEGRSLERTFNEILSAFNQINEQVTNIELLANRQVASTTEITDVAQETQKIISQSRELVTAASKTSTQLSDVSKKLEAEMAQFKTETL